MFKKIIYVIRIFCPSKISVVLLRLIGHSIGKNVVISPFSYIKAKKITFGNNSEIRSLCFITTKEFIIGNSTIISFAAQIKGNGRFITGDNCMVGIQSIIHCDEDVIIGFYSGIGVKNTIYTHSSFLPYNLGYPSKFSKIEIGDFTWISMNVNILAGSKIGSNCIIGPNVVINSEIHDNSILSISPTVNRNIKVDNFKHYFGKQNIEILTDIVNDFLIENKIEYIFKNNKYQLLKKDIVILLNPENEIIEIKIGKNAVVYDLKNYYVSNFKDKFNKDFSKYIRRRFGLRFRVLYN